MARWHQTWKCGACGHTLEKTIRYPKYGASETPLTEIAKRARCSTCGARGQCAITELPAQKPK